MTLRSRGSVHDTRLRVCTRCKWGWDEELQGYRTPAETTSAVEAGTAAVYTCPDCDLEASEVANLVQTGEDRSGSDY